MNKDVLHNNDVVRVITHLKSGDLTNVQLMLERESIKGNISVMLSTNGERQVGVRDITEIPDYELDEIRNYGIISKLNVETRVHSLPMIITVEYTSLEELYKGVSRVFNQ